MNAYQRSQVVSAFAWTVAITAGHFVTGTGSHLLHGLHILLASLYLVPIIIAAVAFGRPGGLFSAAGVSAAYLAHLFWSWNDSPLANADQYAWIVVYPVVGVVLGHLVNQSDSRKREYDEVIARSRHAEMLNGLGGLLAVVGARDASTVTHSQRVAAVATAIAERLGYPAEAVTRIRLAALVHDVGKAGIPDAILFKHGPLDVGQRETMREHVELAVSMLQHIPGTEAISHLVAQHHECPDGSGYPHGLEHDEIDPAAAVLRVADVFVALTEPRPYHEAISSEQAIEAMVPSVGTGFDTRAFEALVHLQRETPMSPAGPPQKGGLA